ncbi:sigma-70 family RNA polymerase sigma factor [Cetobacterium sp. SF1]|uniref:sigma-70 family RNA polymerase sigma factor n=1 Tax=unclassified Cetobacterium TaxID=2630983 RepID=UPI003CF28CE3
MNINNLIYQAQSGDENAYNEIFLHYENFIKYIAKDLFLLGGEKEDLYQEGYIGLIKAIKSFKVEKEINFTSFASLCIKRQMLSAIYSANSLKNSCLNNSIYSFFINEEEFSNQKFIYSYHPEYIYLKKESFEFMKNKILEHLTPMEQKIFLYLISNYDYMEIAKILNISKKSADNAIQRIRKKIYRLSLIYDFTLKCD